jgi:SAP domain
MSKQLDLTKPLDQETIDFLLTKHPIEKVQYWVALSSGSEFDEESANEDLAQAESYDQFTNDQLKERLQARGLPTDGKKSELIERLEESDEKPQGSQG